MKFSLKEKLEKSKKNIIIFLVLWLVLIIVLVAPIATGVTANLAGENQGNVLSNIIAEMTSLGNPAITRAFSGQTIGVFFTDILYFTLGYIVFCIIAIIKFKPKSDFVDIEHGSSGWSKHGEQYAILSKNKGILLAENHYLPVDKPGNVNVLVVGRIWFW